jgi:hypothetical protein
MMDIVATQHLLVIERLSAVATRNEIEIETGIV